MRGCRVFSTCLAAVLACGLVSCDREATPKSRAESVHAVVTIPPQAFVVERIGGAHVTVDVLVGPGQSYHSYEPTPRQVAGLSDARVYFTIGVPFERTLVEKLQSTRSHLEVVDTRAGLTLRSADHECGDSAHDHDGDAGVDPHIWLDPKLVRIQAGTMAAALARLDPVHAADYETNGRAFQAELDAVNAAVARTLAPWKGREFFVFHPSFGYFAAAYGLKQVAVEAGGKEPGGRELAEVIRRAREAGVRTIFVQPQFASTSARTIASEIGGKVVSIDPLASDYINNLYDIAGKIAASFDPAKGDPKANLTTARE